jgi:hypothetical protein
VFIVALPSSASRIKSTVGDALLALGTLLILFYLNSLALQVQPFFSGFFVDTLDSCARLGLALLHALEAIYFEHGLLSSIASNILVLFLAFTITLTGITLRTHAKRQGTLSGAAARVSLKGQG